MSVPKFISALQSALSAGTLAGDASRTGDRAIGSVRSATPTLPLTKRNLNAKFGKPKRGSSIRSQSAGSVKGKKNFRRTRSLQGRRTRITAGDVHKTLGPLIRVKADKEKSLQLAKGGYFDKDTKSDIAAMQKDTDNVVKEFQLAVGAIKAGLGNTPIHLRLTAGFSLQNDGGGTATKVVNIGASAIGAVDASKMVEWSSVSALFDEYKVTHGYVEHNYINAVTLTGVNTNLSDSVPCIGYDPADSTAPTGTATVVQLAQHKMLTTLVAPSATYTTAQTFLHRFDFHVPPGVQTNSGGGVMGDQWQTTNSPAAVGFIKFYHIGATITASNYLGAGVAYLFCQFRCRS